MIRLLCAAILLAATLAAPAQWRVLSPSDQRQTQPPQNYAEGQEVKLGEVCPEDQKFRWLVAELEIPATINAEATAGKVVGVQMSCGDGGEVYVNGVKLDSWRVVEVTRAPALSKYWVLLDGDVMEPGVMEIAVKVGAAEPVNYSYTVDWERSGFGFGRLRPW